MPFLPCDRIARSDKAINLIPGFRKNRSKAYRILIRRNNLPFASYFPLLGLFQGANNTLYSTFVATSALAIRVASTYILQEIPAISYRMVWLNTLFGWGLGCVVTWVYFLRGKWKLREC